jgi:transposase
MVIKMSFQKNKKRVKNKGNIMAKRRSIDHGPFCYDRNKRIKASDLNDEKKNWLAEQVISKKSSYKNIQERYGLSPNTVRTYVQIRKRDGTITTGSPGRPKLVSPIQMDLLRKTLKLKGKINAVRKEKVIDSINESAKATLLERGEAPLRDPLSDSSCYRILKEVKAKTTNAAGTSTVARIREESDPRNYFVQACLLEAYQKNLPFECIVNEDATTYGMGKDGILVPVVFIKDSEGNETDEPVTRETGVEDELGLYIKVYNFISAGGFAAHLVLHIADKSLGPQDFNYRVVNGISHCCSPSGKITICSTRTRNGNDAFYQWLVGVHLFDFVDLCQGNARNFDESIELTPLLLTLDGEAIQLRNFLSTRFRDEFSKRKVILLKGSASCSATGNALDAGNIHKATKTNAKHMRETTVLYTNESSQRKLDNTLSQLLPTWPKDRRDITADRVLRVVKAYKKKLSHDIILHSFQKSGQIPKDEKVAIGDFDFLYMQMLLCKTKPSNEAYNQLQESFLAAVTVV